MHSTRAPDCLKSDRRAKFARWELQTSNSFRRIGLLGDGDVLCGTTHPSDRHPDLLAAPGVLEYIIAAQPIVVLELLDYVSEIEGIRGEVVAGEQIAEW